MKPPAPKPSQRFQILVVDDDPGRAQLLLSNLAALNMESRHASSGALGMQAFRAKMPHLVLLDVMMPGLDGYEVCAQMRQSSTIPILLMNETMSDENVMKGLKIGADDYILKSMHEQVLAARVIAWLRRVYQYDKSVPSAPDAASASNGAHAVASVRAPVTAAETARTQINPPAGWVHCETCGYMGPRAKFQDPAAKTAALNCPVCHAQIILAHSLT